MNTESMYTALGITPAVHRFGEEVLAGLRTRFDEIDRVAEYNQCKVIGAMQKNRVDATHFAATTGYGYNDAGRDNLERVSADCFHTEAALVLWSRIFLREKLSWRHYLMLLLIVVGIVLIGILDL